MSLCHRNSGGRVKVPYSGCDGKERARNKFRIFRFLDAHLARRRNAVIVGLCQVFATRTNEMDRKLKAGSYFVLVPKLISPIPHRGPEPKKRISFTIFIRLTAIMSRGQAVERKSTWSVA